MDAIIETPTPPSSDEESFSFHTAVQLWNSRKLHKYLTEQRDEETFDIDMLDMDGYSALGVLSEIEERTHDERTKIKYLLEFGADPLLMRDKRSILYEAFEAGDTELIKLLMSYADPNKLVETRGRRKQIHCAANLGDVEILLKAIEKCSNINERMEDDLTPLHLAMHQRNIEVTDILLENGADVNARNSRGDSVMHWACYWVGTPHIRLLLEYDPDLSVVDYKGRTPLQIYLELKADCVDVVWWMVMNGASLEATKDTKQTLLHFLATLPMLKPVFNIACMAKALLSYGVPINAQDHLGNTALHMAAAYNAHELAFALIEEGADINIKNHSNKTSFAMTAIMTPYKRCQILTYYAVKEYKGEFKFSKSLKNYINGDEFTKKFFKDCKSEIKYFSSRKIKGTDNFSMLDMLDPEFDGRSSELLDNKDLLKKLKQVDATKHYIFGPPFRSIYERCFQISGGRHQNRRRSNMWSSRSDDDYDSDSTSSLPIYSPARRRIREFITRISCIRLR